MNPVLFHMILPLIWYVIMGIIKFQKEATPLYLA